MTVKQGYKLTEVGVIPEDWEVIEMERVAGIIDPQPDHRTPPESAHGEPYIGISDFFTSYSQNSELRGDKFLVVNTIECRNQFAPG